LGEALGLGDALDMAERYSEHNIIFELDSLIVVNAVKNKARVRREWGAIVKRCINFLSENHRSSISWVNRSKNKVAHELAKWAENSHNSDWPNSAPPCIWPYIQKDIGAFVSS
jgi:ribonuclease HI